jgi:putative ABC transport system substrate-binding protein
MCWRGRIRLSNENRSAPYTFDSGERKLMKRAVSSLFIIALFILDAGDMLHAQKQGTIPRIGVLYLGTRPNANLDVFIQKMGELGYHEGNSIAIEYRFAQGREDRLPELARELVRLKVDAIFTAGTPAVFALKQATKTIPVVFFGTSDPVGTGVVASLAQPGGNITGISAQASDLWPKRLELLKEISPKLSKVAMVWNKNNNGMALEANATEKVAAPLGLAVEDRGVKDPSELELIFAIMSKDRPDGFLALMDPVLNSYRKQILDFLAKTRIPAIFENKEWVEAGGLMSYGPNFPDAFRRAAVQMDKILKGAKPSEIPVEQPTKFELVINLQTAKQIGVTIPPNVLARADRVIR